MASAPETIEQAIDQLKRDMPDREPMTIHDNGGGYRINIMSDAIAQSSSSGGDVVDEWWFADKELLVIDLGGDDDERR
jgi:hypothetical protein